MPQFCRCDAKSIFPVTFYKIVALYLKQYNKTTVQCVSQKHSKKVKKKFIKPRSLRSQSQSGSWELTPISSDRRLQLSPPDYGHKYDIGQDLIILTLMEI